MEFLRPNLNELRILRVPLPGTHHGNVVAACRPEAAGHSSARISSTICSAAETRSSKSDRLLR
jgi:hypothetical protein